MTDDLHLLRDYAQRGSQTAFSTLVGRYVNLVYTAARRQVRSPQLAEEVAQSVFLDLAKQAGKLAPDTHLASWLYTVTRRTAIDFIRRESRRQVREQTASEIAAMNESSPATWLLLEPLLDEAMDTLDELDRRAILLRYFEQRSLREVGAALDSTDDAAQKRVSRAVEQLREFFTKRGAVVSAATLAANLTAHGVETAPAGLALSITTNTLAVGSAAILTNSTATVLTMTILQKSLLALSIIVVAGTGLYEARLASQQNSQIQQIEQDSQRLVEGNRQLRQQRDETQKQLTQGVKLADDKALNPATASKLGDWVASVATLKKWLDQMPDKAIPEFQFLTEDDWLSAVKNADLSTAIGARQALNHLRNLAKNNFVPLLQAAMKKYLTEHNNQLPASVTDLKTYFEVPVSEAMLQRYAMKYTGNVNDVPGGEVPIEEKPEAQVDDTYDTQMKIYATGGYAVYSSPSASSPDMNRLQGIVQHAMQAYNKDHPNQQIKTTADLQPYIADPADFAALQKLESQVHEGP